MMKVKVVVGILIVGMVFGAVTGLSKTIQVPGDYDTIQEAIDEADSDDTIEVAEGTYKERIRIDGKDLTLKADGDVVIREPDPGDAMNIRRETVWVKDSETTIQGFTIDVNSGWGGIYANGGANYDDYPDEEVHLIAEDNRIINYNRNGITINGDLASGHIKDNVAIGKGENSSWANNGIQIGFEATGSMSGNEVRANNWSKPVPDDVGTGTMVYDTMDFVTVAFNEVTKNELQMFLSGEEHLVLGNNVLGGEENLNGNYGIMDVSDNINIHFNAISDNDYGLLHYGTAGDATLNWWGSEDGPTVDGYGGGGDSIVGEVPFSPWLKSNPDDNPDLEGVQIESPLTFVVDDVGPEPQENTFEIPEEVFSELDLSVPETLTLPGGYLGRATFAASALPGHDIVEVRPGTYKEDVTVFSSLDLTGIGSPQPTLEGTLNLGDIEDVTVRNLTIENDGFLMDSGHGTTTFKNVKFKGMDFIDTDNSGRAIYFGYDHGVSIGGEEGLTFEDSFFDGYMILGSFGGEKTGGPITFDDVTLESGVNTYGGTDVTVENSKTQNSGYFYLSGIENLSVKNNEFTAFGTFVNGADGEDIINNTFKNITTYPALSLTAAWGPTQNYDVSVENNTFSNISTDAIKIYSYTASEPNSDFLDVHYNQFSNIGGYAINNTFNTFTVNATRNYWGDPTGPDHVNNPHQNPQGEEVKGLVDFKPWYATDTTTSSTENVSVDHPGSSIIAYSDTIQGGIDAALSGDTVDVTAGTYEEQLIINKGISLQGAGSGESIIEATHSDEVYGLLYAGNFTPDLTFTGFTVEPAKNKDYFSFLFTGPGESGNQVSVTDNEFEKGYLYFDHVNQDIYIANNQFDYIWEAVGYERSYGEMEIFNNTMTAETPFIGIFNWSWNLGKQGEPDNYTSKQWIHSNTIDAGGGDGIVYLSAESKQHSGCDGGVCTFPNRAAFENLVFENNAITNVAGAGFEEAGIALRRIYGQDSNGNWDYEGVPDQIGFENAVISSNDITGQAPADGVVLYGSKDTEVTYNVIKGFDEGIYLDGVIDGTNINYNSIANNDFGVRNTTSTVVDGTFNWWGDPTGPSVQGPGSGDAVSENVVFSPWFGFDPDTDPDEPGVQLPGAMAFVVDDVGPEPDGGYLKTALDAAASGLFPDQNTIYIRSAEEDENYAPVIGEGVITPELIILSGGSSLEFNKNTLVGPVTHQGTETADFSFNFWGGTPNVSENTENLLLNPWLLKEPGSPNMIYQVGQLGADPEGGVNRAVVDANQDDDQDTVLVNHGKYDAPQTIDNPVRLLSEPGSASGTSLEGDVDIGSNDVILGREGQGFTVGGDVAIVTGTDAGDGNVQVNRNILLGTFTHDGSGIVDALFNNWNTTDPTEEPPVNGNDGNVLYSPWLLNTPGAEDMTYIVNDVGADPEGSLNRAIGDANKDTNVDTIIVNHGNYTASSDQPITENVNIVSVKGSPANTFINGDELSIDASDVTVGKRAGYVSRGFTVNADVTIESGVDASKLEIRWNNLLGEVTNNGNNELDARYNWWGNMNPSEDIDGEVNYTPFLPESVGNVLDYMETNGLESPKAAVAGIIAENASLSEEATAQLTGMGLDVDAAGDLLDEYGTGTVLNAMNNADTSSEFVQLLGGYGLPAGAAGGLTNNTVAGGAGSVGDRTIGAVFAKGETIEVSFPLADFEGNPAKNLHPTVSLVSLDEDGEKTGLEKVSAATYGEEEEAYMAAFETAGLESGYYEVQIDLPDGSSLSQVIELEGEEG